MPKKAKPETQEEQSARFRKDAQKLIDAGELSPTEAKQAIDSNLKGQNNARRESETPRENEPGI